MWWFHHNLLKSVKLIVVINNPQGWYPLSCFLKPKSPSQGVLFLDAYYFYFLSKPIIIIFMFSRFWAWGDCRKLFRISPTSRGKSHDITCWGVLLFHCWWMNAMLYFFSYSIIFTPPSICFSHSKRRRVTRIVFCDVCHYYGVLGLLSELNGVLRCWVGGTIMVSHMYCSLLWFYY